MKMKKYKRLSLISRGAQEEHGHLGGDALVQQFLNRMNVGDIEENDSTEEENKVRSSYEANASAMENGIQQTIFRRTPLHQQLKKHIVHLLRIAKKRNFIFDKRKRLPKRKNYPGKSLGLEHLAADIQFCTSPISTSTHKFNSSWNAHADTDEDLRKSLREASTILVRRRISKGSSHIRQAMLTSENDDDIWLAKRISYQMPHGSDKLATHATIKLRKKRHKAARLNDNDHPAALCIQMVAEALFSSSINNAHKTQKNGSKELDHSRRLWEVQVYFEIGFAEQKF